VIRADEAFAKRYAQLDPDWYQFVVSGLARTLFDRDTAPGPEPEDLLSLDIPALVVPGQDASHATSAAMYLRECLPGSRYLDLPVSEQTDQSVPPRLLDFLSAADRPASPA
jgi:hypothetical protein